MRIAHSLIAAATISLPIAASAAISAAPIQWTADVHAPIYNIPRVADGTVYVSTAQAKGPNVFAVKEGKVLWRFATEGAIQMPVSLGGAQVFVASDVGDIHFMRAIDAKTGALIWDYTRHEPPECMCSHVTHYIQHLLFAETDGHSLYAFYPVGKIPDHRLWTFVGDGAKLTPPVLADSTVIFGSADHNVYGLVDNTGKIRWQQKTGYAFVAQPAVWEHTVILGNRGGTVHAYSTTTGKPLWNFTTNGPIDTAALIWHDWAFVASGAGGRGVYALSAKTGKQIWYTQMTDYTAYPPVMARQTLIVASRDGHLLGLAAKTGKVLWRSNLHGVPLSQPVLWQGVAVLKVNDHQVMAFNAQSGRPVWTYHSKDVVTSPVPEGDRVYVGTSGGAVVAIGH
ncbi:MAG: outer membrane protein assembly factor BamB family protein [Acidithiobacillus sp.]|jgi:outer membrane protein assembly factor BamB|nr:PQQ-binding-like beta-propeller repeat protein [Acidithiobacillus sp.]